MNAALHQEKKEKDQKLLTNLAVGFGKAGDSESEEDKEREDDGKGIGDILDAHVNSKILNNAFNRLHRRDIRERRSAAYIQRRWRKKAVDASKVHRTKGALSESKTKFVHAPAYLGESCLWAPHEDWEGGPATRYPYSACCENRCEFVYIPRFVIKDIIDRFSPWLSDRFEYFRAAVVKSMDAAFEEGKRKEEEEEEAERSLEPVKEETEAAVDEAPAAGAESRDASGSSSSPTVATMAGPAEASSSSAAASTLYTLPQGEMEVPVGNPNYEAFAEMNKMLGYERGGGTPYNPFTQHPKSARSARSFRAAAAAAVARVGALGQTPRAHGTPPHITPHATPRNGWGAAAASAAANGNPMAEPLLQNR